MKEHFIILKNTAAILNTRDHLHGPIHMPAVETFRTPIINIEISETDQQGLADMMSLPEVERAAPSMPLKLVNPENTADIESSDNVWGINAVGATSSPYTGNGITMAILDTGIDKAHVAFDGVELVEKDFTGDGNGDSNGHGTHVAGTIFGRDVNGKRIGIARGVKKALIGKVLGARGGSTYMLMKAIEWAVDSGADIISMSLGIDFPSYVKRLEQKGYPTEAAVSMGLEGYRANVALFESIMKQLYTAGKFGFNQTVLTIAAAGNDNPGGKFEVNVSPPAVSEGIVSVGAVKKQGKGYVIADFSNRKPNISAPGVDILSAQAGTTAGLVSFNGTSMATPHVAGVAALIMEKYKKSGNTNPQFLAAKLLASGDTSLFPASYPAYYMGAGIVMAPQS